MLHKNDFKLGTRIAFQVTSEINIPVELEGIKSLPLCQARRVYFVNLQFITTF
ncbi:hypothetical protein MtrunA17_Chr4g0044821 [Medicago truncatula]|uniref:Uncharacterized protein n=1 Tax=Medicago truncatula TaxID=3880 RepID=A0A396I9B4_MEDTR|nr:hypothetical protein MtrunA17_Chr4g0044821 [Medicago truncatula]